MEEAKIRAEYEKKQDRYLSYAERLERKAPANFALTEDDMPDHLDSLYDGLEETQGAKEVIRRINAKEAGWLAHYIRKQLEKEQEKLLEEIEKELNASIKQCSTMSAKFARMSSPFALCTVLVSCWSKMLNLADILRTEGHKLLSGTRRG